MATRIDTDGRALLLLDQKEIEILIASLTHTQNLYDHSDHEIQVLARTLMNAKENK